MLTQIVLKEIMECLELIELSGFGLGTGEYHCQDFTLSLYPQLRERRQAESGHKLIVEGKTTSNFLGTARNLGRSLPVFSWITMQPPR